MENDGKGGGAYYLHIDGQRGSLDRQLAAFMMQTDAAVTPPTEDHGRARAVD